MVARLLEDLDRHCGEGYRLNVVVTVNVEEELPFQEEDFGFPLEIIRNRSPAGFGANHNAAFGELPCDYFCVLNPDLRLDEDPFPRLLETLRREKCGVVAPTVVGEEGRAANARRFPTPWTILGKALGIGWGAEYAIDEEPVEVDWVGGMFMLLPCEAFAEVSGFDTGYHLYYEDVDLCRRVRESGWEVVLEPRATVTHLAQHASHRDLKHLARHMSSMLRFFLSRSFTVRKRSRM